MPCTACSLSLAVEHWRRDEDRETRENKDVIKCVRAMICTQMTRTARGWNYITAGVSLRTRVSSVASVVMFGCAIFKENCKHQYLRPSICAIWASTALILTITATISWLTNLLTKIWLPNILINDHHFSHLSSRKSNFCWLQLIKYEGLLLFLVITDSKWRLLACWRCHFRLFLGLLLTNSTFLLMLCLRSLGLHRLCQGKKKKKKLQMWICAPLTGNASILRKPEEVPGKLPRVQ